MIVERIFISPERGAAQAESEQITVQSQKGIQGDRNFGKKTHPGQNITLVEAEEIERFCAEHSRPSDLSVTRRNLITRGVRLNELVNVEFSIGNVRLRGIELCEPCSLMGNSLSSETLTSAAVIKHWLHRGGLLADVLSNGEITRGDGIKIDT
ncbi:MOSC domain-containing protein [Iodobacter sp. LRB]|uniref:MOSC domain-containing protein n=1 Tax=unclassified Iodobacter TaxID=235634 RepID=UPI000C103365|nr:MOSC domain-containing protein [Iodobacter sp. BJB302]PHV02382.1 sulfurase [Iodobacter sp. BJB302]